jgi:hypothetical protein
MAEIIWEKILVKLKLGISWMLSLARLYHHTIPLWGPSQWQVIQRMVAMAYTTVLFDQIIIYQTTLSLLPYEIIHGFSSRLSWPRRQLDLAMGGWDGVEFFFFFPMIFSHVNGCYFTYWSVGMTLVYGEDDHMTSFNADETLFHSP